MAARGWAAAAIPRSDAGSWEFAVGPCLPCPPAFPRVAVPSACSVVPSACSVVPSACSVVRWASAVVRSASAAAEWASAAWPVAPAVTSRACRRQRHRRRHRRPGPSTGVHGPRPPPERRRGHTRHNPHADLQHADAWTVTFSRALRRGLNTQEHRANQEHHKRFRLTSPRPPALRPGPGACGRSPV